MEKTPNLNPIKTNMETHRRRLPHWEAPDRVYFLTFRLADALPINKVRHLKAIRANWLINNPKPWDKETAREYYRAVHQQWHQWLDQGFGSCFLKAVSCRSILVNALHHFDQERYVLDAYVIMPNHVHLLVMPFASHTLTNITHSWKSFSSNEINKNLKRTGALWMREGFDHIVRSPEALQYHRKYIEDNPIRAALPSTHFTLGYGTGLGL